MSVTSFALRCRWLPRALGFNPLIRASDRLEALAVLAIFVTALFALPVAAHAGNLIYHAGARAASEQAATRHFVEAVALDSSSRLPADFDGPAYVRAQWREGTRLRTEQVIPPMPVTAGEQVKVWLDQTGTIVAKPMTTEDAELSAVVAAVTVWVVVTICAALVALVIRIALDRSRDRAWDRELHLLAYNDDGWANRHT